MPEREYNVNLFTEKQLAEYHNDARWARAKELTAGCRFGEANAVVLKIQEDHKCFEDIPTPV